MRKLFNKLLDKLTAKQTSFLILAICYVIIITVITIVLVSIKNYDLNEFEYSYDSSPPGILKAGQQPETIFSYGPYTDLGMGNYKLTIDYSAEYSQSFDLIYRDKDGVIITIDSGDLDNEVGHTEFVFCNEESINNESFEIRTHYSGEGSFQLRGVKLERCFVFKWYILITIVTAVLSMVLFVGKKFHEILDYPKRIMYCAVFYTIAILLIIFSMAFMPEQSGEWLYIFLNLAIILHAYGLKKHAYRFFTRKNVYTILSYIYIVFSFYLLDLILRYSMADDTKLSFSSYEPNLFSFSIIGLFVVIIALIPKCWIKRLVYGITYYLFTILVFVQLVYYKVFNKLFSFKDMKLAKEGSDYSSYVVSLLDKDFIRTAIILIIVGVAGILMIRKSFRMNKAGYLVVVSVIASVMLYNHTIYGGDYGEWNSFDNANYIYATFANRVGAFELCGFYQYELRDLELTLFNGGAKTKDQIKEVDNYYEAKESARKNIVSGILEDKNVIFVLMESIDDICLNESVMPILYRMSQQGISFTNMYASIYGSAATLNSEMVTNVGMYAPTDGSLVYSFSDNYFPYSLATKFTAKGYAARQYHMNDPSFYSRQLMNKAFGYKEYVCYKDYVSQSEYIRDDILPGNYELFKTLIQDEKFFDYVITYSGHLSYSSNDLNVEYALENHPEYSSMTDSEELNYYFAKARITDDMFAGLIERLRESGDLADTVIVAIGDHYPYGIEDKEKLYELSDVESYEHLLYKVPFIIWTPGMEEMDIPHTVDKVCSSIDVVPTLVNIFNLGDTSVYVGNDIFDDEYQGLAYFADGSWLTNDAYYYKGSLVYGDMTDEEISEINEMVLERIKVNDAILTTDYYREK